MAQLVKNPPAMGETWVRSLGSEDLREEGKATHSSILAWRIPWALQVDGVAKSRTRLYLPHALLRILGVKASGESLERKVATNEYWGELGRAENR